MAFKTRVQLTTEVYQELSLVPGTSVQTYNEPMVYTAIQRAFDHLFKKRFWPHLTSTTFHTLDGAGGVTTDSILSIEDITDVQWIRKTPYRESDKIPYFVDGIFDSDMLSYTLIPYGEVHWDTKRFKFNPITSTEQIAVRARRKPPTFGDADIIPFDDVMMVHLVTANLLASDGLNPGQLERQQGLFEDRYSSMISNEADHTIESKKNRWSSDFTVEGT